MTFTILITIKPQSALVSFQNLKKLNFCVQHAVMSTQTVNGSTDIDLLLSNLLGYWKHLWLYDLKLIILSDNTVYNNRIFKARCENFSSLYTLDLTLFCGDNCQEVCLRMGKMHWFVIF